MTPRLDRALSLARRIDAVTGLVGRLARWAVLLDVLVASGNALSRKFLDLTSNSRSTSRCTSWR